MHEIANKKFKNEHYTILTWLGWSKIDIDIFNWLATAVISAGKNQLEIVRLLLSTYIGNYYTF